MGRFGQALALELMTLGAEVLVIDSSPDVIQSLNGKVTHAVVADATKEEVLRQLGINELDVVVVAIGDSVENNVLVTSLLLSFDIKEIWAKAVSEAHGRILAQIGVDRVIYPETEMGRRVAHVLRGSLADYFDLGDGLALVRTEPPAAASGRPIKDVRIRSTYGVTVIAVKKKDGGTWEDVTRDTVLETTDQILVAGPRAKAEGFHKLR